MTISSWLNFGHHAPPGRGSVGGEIFGSALLQPVHSVCGSLSDFVIFAILKKLMTDFHPIWHATIGQFTGQQEQITHQLYCWLLSNRHISSQITSGLTRPTTEFITKNLWDWWFENRLQVRRSHCHPRTVSKQWRKHTEMRFTPSVFTAIFQVDLG